MRIGLVGTGSVTQQHLRGFGATGRTELVGVVSRTRAGAETITSQHGGTGYDSLERLLDDGRPDAVVVCLPPYLNPAACRLLVERRIPFLVEKPLAATDDGAVSEIAAAVSAAGLVTAVGYQLRAVEFIPEVRRLLAEKPVQLVVGRWIDDTPPPPWWGRTQEGGGQIVEQQTHQFDICRHLLGEGTVVGAAATGRSRSSVPGADITGVGSAVLHFESGAIGSFANAGIAPRGGVIDVQLISDGRVVTIRWHGWPTVTYELHVADEEGERSATATADPWLSQATAFLDGVESADVSRPFSTYPDAAETYRLTRRIIAAAGFAG
jgi:myo-inositol 2-dehydrogenase/D-chiro-inositol 1-dehydrogenase